MKYLAIFVAGGPGTACVRGNLDSCQVTRRARGSASSASFSMYATGPRRPTIAHLKSVTQTTTKETFSISGDLAVHFIVRIRRKESMWRPFVFHWEIHAMRHIAFLIAACWGILQVGCVAGADQKPATNGDSAIQGSAANLQINWSAGRFRAGKNRRDANR